MSATFNLYIPAVLRNRFTFYTATEDATWHKATVSEEGSVRTPGNLALVQVEQPAFPDVILPGTEAAEDFYFYAAIYGGRNLPLFTEVAGFAYGLHPLFGEAAVSLMVMRDEALPLPTIAEAWVGYGPERCEYVDFCKACIKGLYGEDLGSGYYSALRATFGYRRDFDALMYDAAVTLASRAGYTIVPDAFGGVEPFLFRDDILNPDPDPDARPAAPLDWEHTAGSMRPDKVAPALAKARDIVAVVKG